MRNRRLRRITVRGQQRPALDVVLEGLARLEYRGYDSAGVALLTDEGLVGRRSAPASWPTASRRWTSEPLPRDRHRHRPHPLGHPRRPHRRQRPPAPGGRRQDRRGPQRHHRELRRAARPSWRPTASSSPAETDTEVAAHLVGRRPTTATGDLPAAMRGGRRPARGRVHPGRRPRRRPGRRGRRPPQLAAGGRRRRRRELPRLRRRGVHRLHPRGRSSSARTRW